LLESYKALNVLASAASALSIVHVVGITLGMVGREMGIVTPTEGKVGRGREGRGGKPIPILAPMFIAEGHQEEEKEEALPEF
jgi:hypothetical protein